MHSKFNSLILIAIIAFSGPLYAALDCNTDCGKMFTNKIFCGVRKVRISAFRWEQENHYCDSVDIIGRASCEATKKSACAIGKGFTESDAEGTEMYHLENEVSFADFKFNEGFRGAEQCVAAGTGSVCAALSLLEGMREDATKGVLICEDKEKFNDTKNGRPGLHWEAIYVGEYCRLRWRHLSNTWGNLFGRSTTMEACRTWLDRKKLSGKAFAFRCVDTRDMMEEQRARIAREANQTYGEYDKHFKEKMSTISGRFTPEAADGFGAANNAKVAASTALAAIKAEEESLNQSIAKRETELQLAIAERTAAENDAAQVRVTMGEYSAYFEQAAHTLRERLIRVDTLFKSFKTRLPKEMFALAQLNMFVRDTRAMAQGTEFSKEAVEDVAKNYKVLKATIWDHSCEKRLFVADLKKIHQLQFLNNTDVERIDGTLAFLVLPNSYKSYQHTIRKNAEVIISEVEARDVIFNEKLMSLYKRPSICNSFEALQITVDGLKQLAQSAENSAILESEYMDIIQRFKENDEKYKRRLKFESIRQSVRQASNNFVKLIQEGYIKEALEQASDFQSRYIWSASEAKKLAENEAELVDFNEKLAAIKADLERAQAREMNVRKLQYVLGGRAELLFFKIDDLQRKAQQTSESEAESFRAFIGISVGRHIAIEADVGINVPQIASLESAVEVANRLTAAESLVESYAVHAEHGD